MVLRILVAIAVTLAAASFVIAFFPGIEVYRGDQLVGTLPVIQERNWLLGILVVLLAPGLVLWRAPRIGYALLWSIWAIVLATLAFIATFETGPFTVRTVPLWPHDVFGVVMFALLFHLIVIVPATCGILWWVKRERPPRVELPVARLVTSSSARPSA